MSHQAPEPEYLLQGINSNKQWRTLFIFTTQREAITSYDAVRCWNIPTRTFRVIKRSYKEHTYSEEIII